VGSIVQYTLQNYDVGNEKWKERIERILNPLSLISYFMSLML